MDNDIFLKIIQREIPADIVYEDDACIAFHDISPQAPVHVLLVPKTKIAKLSEFNPAQDADVLHTFGKIGHVAKILGLEDFRTVINNGETACQTVFHIHIHILGGRQFNWPPG